MFGGRENHVSALVFDAENMVNGIVLYRHVAVLHFVMLNIEPVGQLTHQVLLHSFGDVLDSNRIFCDGLDNQITRSVSGNISEDLSGGLGMDIQTHGYKQQQADGR